MRTNMEILMRELDPCLQHEGEFRRVFLGEFGLPNLTVWYAGKGGPISGFEIETEGGRVKIWSRDEAGGEHYRVYRRSPGGWRYFQKDLLEQIDEKFDASGVAEWIAGEKGVPEEIRAFIRGRMAEYRSVAQGG